MNFENIPNFCKNLALIFSCRIYFFSLPSVLYVLLQKSPFIPPPIAAANSMSKKNERNIFFTEIWELFLIKNFSDSSPREPGKF
jgi:hypothetical protein